ncbi:MAG: glycosyltransferase [Anaerolineales bacterium]|nr:glycosyltransferase [Anaerolineales bacterium]
MPELTSHPERLHILVVTNLYPGPKDPGVNPCVKIQVEDLREFPDLKIHLYYIQRGSKTAYLKAFLHFFLMNFSSNPYDLVHAYYGYSGWAARLYLRAPLVVTYLGTDLLGGYSSSSHRLNGFLGRFLTHFIKHAVVMTSEMKSAVEKTPSSIIPFTIEEETFITMDYSITRAELGFNSDTRYVLFPYNPSRPEKNFHLINAAVQELTQRGYPVELITVFGQPPRVIARYMNACDAFVLVSEHEGSPAAVREALACRLPIIANDVGDVRSLIETIPGCALCRKDTHDIAEKLDQVLRKPQRLQLSGDLPFPSRQQINQNLHDLYYRICNE